MLNKLLKINDNEPIRMDDEVGKLKEMYMSYNNEMQGFEGKEIARLNSTLRYVYIRGRARVEERERKREVCL